MQPMIEKTLLCVAEILLCEPDAGAEQVYADPGASANALIEITANLFAGGAHFLPGPALVPGDLR